MPCRGRFAALPPRAAQDGLLERAQRGAVERNESVFYAEARIEEVGDEVVATYESTKTDGGQFRNTEILEPASPS